METCNCLMQQSIPNYKPIEYISIGNAINIIENHSEYDSDKYTINIYESIESHSSIVTITMESYKCTYTFQYYEIPINLFMNWLGNTFEYFNKMEESDDIF